MYIPPNPKPGDELKASLITQILDTLRSLIPSGGPGIRVTRTPSGTTITRIPDVAPVVEQEEPEDEAKPCVRIGTVLSGNPVAGLNVSFEADAFGPAGRGVLLLPEVAPEDEVLVGTQVLCHMTLVRMSPGSSVDI